MTSLLLGTASLLSSSASIVTGFRHVSARVRELVSPGRGFELRDIDKRKLLAIQKRVECLIQPLNFCVLWSKNKNTCIQSTIRYAQEIIERVSSYIDSVRFVQSETDAFIKTLDEESTLKLDYLLGELDFACSSISMSVSLTQISPPTSQTLLSPAALLKASSRIQAMQASSGDLVVVDGRLFSRDSTSPDSEWSELFPAANFRLNKSSDAYSVKVSAGNADQPPLNLPVSLNCDFFLTTLQSLGLDSPVDSAVLAWSQMATVDESMVSVDSSDAEMVIVTESTRQRERPRLFALEIRGCPAGEEWSPIDLLYITRI